jgi:dipeptidyl aminopeptidase/acylaminoacyl peptidase
MKYLSFVVCILIVNYSSAQRNASVSFEKWISLKTVGSPVISPDGKTVVYSVTSTDWANNSYDTELWMSRDGSDPVQLTRTAKNSSTTPRFTPDNKFVSFLADRGEKNQIYIISVNGGEAIQVTKDEDGINSYEWSPDGSKILYAKSETDTKQDKTIKERFGAFGVEGEEYKQTHLWLLNFSYDSILLAGQTPCYTIKKDSSNTDSLIKLKKQDCYTLPVATAFTKGNFTVNGFAWSPDGKKVLINFQSNPLINSGITSDIAVIDVASKKIDSLVKNPTGDFFSRWSPDGKSFLYSSAVNDSTSFYYTNNRLFVYDMATKTSREIATDIDENKFAVDWNKRGFFFRRWKKQNKDFILLTSSAEKLKRLPFL